MSLLWLKQHPGLRLTQHEDTVGENPQQQDRVQHLGLGVHRVLKPSPSPIPGTQRGRIRHGTAEQTQAALTAGQSGWSRIPRYGMCGRGSV